MKLYAMEDIIETIISVPDIKGAPYVELKENLAELKPALVIPECSGCMGASYNPRDCEECDRRRKMPIDFYDRCDIVEVERDAFERGYKAAKEEDMDNDSKDYILLQKGWMYRSAGGEDLITSTGEISHTIAEHNRYSGTIKINEEMHFMELLAILHEFGLI